MNMKKEMGMGMDMDMDMDIDMDTDTPMDTDTDKDMEMWCLASFDLIWRNWFQISWLVIIVGIDNRNPMLSRNQAEIL
jgi:hypothetical protein